MKASLLKRFMGKKELNLPIALLSAFQQLILYFPGVWLQSLKKMFAKLEIILSQSLSLLFYSPFISEFQDTPCTTKQY